MNDDVIKFCKKYDATVDKSQKRFRRVMPVRFEDVSDRISKNYLDTYEENYLEILMPEDRFRSLLEFENKLSRYQADSGAFESLLKELQKEIFLRKKNPALEKAYEHYKLLLKLTESDFPDA